MKNIVSSRGSALTLAIISVVVLACADSLTAVEKSPLDGLTQVAINDSGVAVPLDSLPPDSLPPDSLPPDSLPPDSLPPDSLPPDSLPPDSLPPDSLPPVDSVPPLPADTVDSLPPPAPTPGYFRGNVVGQFQAGPGQDSVASAPRLANIRVTIYPRLSSSDPLAVGPPAASVLTDSNGSFQLPVLAGGEYVVTFNPPEGSIYRGVWATATVNSHSGDHPWWVVLSLK